MQQRDRAAARLRAAIDDPRVHEAAAIASAFHIDPVLVLAETDPMRVLLRRAAAMYVQAETEKAEKAARRRAR